VVQSASKERRRHERLGTSSLVCLLGEVLNISESGAMIHHRGGMTRKVGDHFTALLRHEGHAVIVHMKLVRCERVGYRRYNLGVEFQGVDNKALCDLGILADAAHDAFIGPQAYTA